MRRAAADLRRALLHLRGRAVLAGSRRGGAALGLRTPLLASQTRRWPVRAPRHHGLHRLRASPRHLPSLRLSPRRPRLAGLRAPRARAHAQRNSGETIARAARATCARSRAGNVRRSHAPAPSLAAPSRGARALVHRHAPAPSLAAPSRGSASGSSARRGAVYGARSSAPRSHAAPSGRGSPSRSWPEHAPPASITLAGVSAVRWKS